MPPAIHFVTRAPASGDPAAPDDPLAPDEPPDPALPPPPALPPSANPPVPPLPPPPAPAVVAGPSEHALAASKINPPAMLDAFKRFVRWFMFAQSWYPSRAQVSRETP